MYPTMGAAAGTAAGTALAVTGASVGWIVLAGAALVAAGFAVMRLVPKRNNA